MLQVIENIKERAIYTNLTKEGVVESFTLLYGENSRKSLGIRFTTDEPDGKNYEIFFHDMDHMKRLVDKINVLIDKMPKKG